jgi:hypothetical protein
MAMNKRLIGVINQLIYGAQFEYPMAPAAPLIYEGVVDARRPTHPMPQVLSDIQAILAEGSIPLESLIPIPHETSEEEIRAFLQRLAEEIEKHNPNVIRSGRPVPQSGQWLCYEDLEHSVILSKGEIAPDYRPGGNVWVLAPTNANPTAKERVLGDFAENFIPNALRGIKYADPDYYAQALFKRLSAGADAKMLAELSTVLGQLMQSPDSPLLDEIKNASGFDWTECEVRWAFLQNLVRGVIRQLGERQNQFHGDTSG